MAQGPGDVDPTMAEPSSRSQLLAPSAGSTDRPSREYGASDDSRTRSDSAASFELLLPKKPEENTKSKIQHFLGNKRHVRVAASLLALLGILVVIISCLVHSSGGMSKGPFGRKSSRFVGSERAPFSLLDPIKDLKLYSLSRPEDSSPPKSVLRGTQQRALPTNAWYQNLLMAKGEPSMVHRAYSMPYVIDLAGPVPGIRAHPNHLDASTTVVQLSFVDSHGLTLGASAADLKSSKPPSTRYSVVSTTALAATLKWHSLPMTASVVKGMPYTTMLYPMPLSDHDLLPTIASEMKLSAPPLADGKIKIECGAKKSTRVESELMLSFQGSDFTWLVFFSQPIFVKCTEQSEGMDSAAVLLQVTELADTDDNDLDLEHLTVRAALLNNCTNGYNQIFCKHKESEKRVEKHAKLLRERAHLYPGPRADVDYDIDSENDEAILKFDWDVQNMKGRQDDATDLSESHLRRDTSANEDDQSAPLELITYALPHHLHRMPAVDFMPWGEERFCTKSLIGSICIVSGSSWRLPEELPPIAFQAPRPPKADTIGAIANALSTDLSYQIADYYQRGAGDTYFSGKMLARMARVLLIGEELINLCTSDSPKDLGYSLTSEEATDYAKACKSIQLPSQGEMTAAISRLRSSVEVWTNGTAETPFVYDSGWGGVISCGCQFDTKISGCSNQFPDCPSIQDPGMNFGNVSVCGRCFNPDCYSNAHHYYFYI